MREKLSLALNRDGGLDSLELKGDLDLRVASADASKVIVSLSHSDAFGNDLQFKTHPRIDKKAWTDGQRVQLRDLKQAFPVKQGLAVLKWRLTTKDESVVPLSSEFLKSRLVALLSSDMHWFCSQLLAIAKRQRHNGRQY